MTFGSTSGRLQKAAVTERESASSCITELHTKIRDKHVFGLIRDDIYLLDSMSHRKLIFVANMIFMNM